MRRRAFTLIELTMVLAIIAIISAMAIPRFGASLVRARVDQAAGRVAGDIALLRSLAIREGAALALSFNPAVDAYQMPGVPHPDHPASGYQVDLSAIPYEVDLVSADFGGEAHLVFDGYGVPQAAGQVVLRAGGEVRAVTVAALSGAVSVVGQ